VGIYYLPISRQIVKFDTRRRKEEETVTDDDDDLPPPDLPPLGKEDFIMVVYFCPTKWRDKPAAFSTVLVSKMRCNCNRFMVGGN